MDTQTVETKADAIARVDRNANAQWKDLILFCIGLTAKRMAELTVDDVWDTFDAIGGEDNVSTHEKRAIGAQMDKARRAGLIIATDRIQSSRLGNKRWKARVWLSGSK